MTDSLSELPGAADKDLKNFDRLTQSGQTGGLFQECMAAIRTAHFQANRFRAVLVVAGLFTDKNMYREAIALFYSVTKVLEDRLESIHDETCQKILALGYNFTKPYEQDLQFLYGTSWRKDVESALNANKHAQSYIQTIQDMQTGSELSGAVFCLWGALIIGGGAAAKPNVQALFGEDAVHLFESVSGPGRAERKRSFVELWDSLPKEDDATTMIVQSCQSCMQRNNDILCTIRRNPWWYVYVQAAGVLVVSMILYRFLHNGWKFA